MKKSRVKDRFKIADRLGSAGAYISGEELGRALGISRTAVWKQIRWLEGEGFVIEARPRLGYRLVSYPDKLLPILLQNRLETSVMGRNVFYYQAVDSTNSVARILAEQGAVEGSVVVAEEQTGGKGRYGRHWISPQGANVLVSIILRPNLLTSGLSRLAILGAVSVAESVRRVTRLEVRLRWPHEILLSDKKVGGILTEFSADIDRVDFGILGIGLNVNFKLTEFPELAGEATSLSDEVGVRVSRVELLRVLLEQLEYNYELMRTNRFNVIAEKWNSHCWGAGNRVQITSAEGKYDGILKRIDDNGSLVIGVGDGEQKVVMGGGVSLDKKFD